MASAIGCDGGGRILHDPGPQQIVHVERAHNAAIVADPIDSRPTAIPRHIV